MEYRNMITRLYYDDHLSEREIAINLRLPFSTVHYWVARKGKAKTKRQGRPRCTDKTIDDTIYEATKENPFMTSVSLQEKFNLNCSLDTIRRRLKERGLKCRIPARKPFLTDRHRQNRETFASEHLGWTLSQWNKVVFSDEKIFRASSVGQIKVYRPTKSNRFDPAYLSVDPLKRHTVAVWMAFGASIRCIHQITQKTLNSEYYTTTILPLIEEELVRNDLIFMQDLSSIHTSKMSKKWFEDHNVCVLNNWPAKAPDMNPVENVWAELVRRITHMEPKTDNRDQLWERILVAFNSLPNEYFQKLLESMPRRMSAVKTLKGGWSKY